MKFRENRKINNSWTTRALFRVNGVSIDYLEMDYKCDVTKVDNNYIEGQKEGVLGAISHTHFKMEGSTPP